MTDEQIIAAIATVLQRLQPEELEKNGTEQIAWMYFANLKTAKQKRASIMNSAKQIEQRDALVREADAKGKK